MVGDSAHLDVPSDEVAREAHDAVQRLRDLHPTHVHVVPDHGANVSVTVPLEAFRLLVRILGHMANGDAVTILSVHAELTTQQAADLLGVSRPHVVKLLDEGVIPYHKAGTHRRVRLTDVLAHQRREHERRRKILQELAADAQEMGEY